MNISAFLLELADAEDLPDLSGARMAHAF